MHVSGEVEVAIAVEGHGDVVVAVPPDGLGKDGEGPIGVVEGALRDGHATVGVVEGDVLVGRIGEQCEADGVPGPDGCNIEDGGGVPCGVCGQWRGGWR